MGWFSKRRREATFGEIGGPLNLYCTIVDLPAAPVPVRAQRDRSDPELAGHLEGFCGFVLSQVQGAPTPSQAHLVEHLWRVHNHLVFDIGPEHEAAVTAFAVAANAVMFLADGTVRAPDGGIIVGPNGGDADTPHPPAALARSQAVRARLEQQGFITPEHSPPSPCEAEVRLRSPQDVWARASGLAIAALRAESVASGDPIDPRDLGTRLPLAELSDHEAAFVQMEHPPSDMLPAFTWRYESLAALQWALGLQETLGSPDTLCDAAIVARRMFDTQVSPALRSASEILDALETHFRLHWWVRQAEMEGRSPDPLVGGVIHERRVALQWLIALGQFAWDEIPTPT